MKKSVLFLMLGFVAVGAIAEEKVISVDGKEVSYVAKAEQKKEGVVLTTGTIFVGERIVKDDAGVCSKETFVLNALNKVKSMDLEVQVPDVTSRREQIKCPA